MVGSLTIVYAAELAATGIALGAALFWVRIQLARTPLDLVQFRLFKEVARFKRGVLLAGSGIVAGAIAAAVLAMFGTDSNLWATVLFTLASILFWSGAVSILSLFRVPTESRAIR